VRVQADLTEDVAATLATIALGHVTREYPNKLDHVLAGPEDTRTPRDLHPVFYGSYDWHSCVHTYWTLAHLLRRFPRNARADEICALLDAQLVPHKIAAECAYSGASSARGFERPYGWAWLLKLAEELRQYEERRWSSALAPLADVFVRRFREFLPKAIYPVRTGTHSNTAFALAMAADYAGATHDSTLAALLRDKAVGWYGQDVDCPAWEPSGEDFLSPALMEAECMRRLLPEDRFTAWFAAFLPQMADGHPATLFRPVQVSDRTDGSIAHLDGLNLSRAWCWRGLASALPEDDVRNAALEAADRHLAAGLPHIAEHYMGQHWLATFALLAMQA
jgi:Protein of unknown function (DUF2891)